MAVVLVALGFATGFFGGGDGFFGADFFGTGFFGAGFSGAGDGFFAAFFGAGAFVFLVLFAVFEGASTGSGSGSVALRFLEELAGAIVDVRCIGEGRCDEV